MRKRLRAYKNGVRAADTVLANMEKRGNLNSRRYAAFFVRRERLSSSASRRR